MSFEPAAKGCLLHLPIGALIQVSSDDNTLKYMTHLVGIDGEKTIISNIPSMKRINKEGAVFEDIFYQERPLIMRVLAGGLAYAFQTNIIGCHHGHSRLLLSTYPDVIQQRNLRKEARYPCTLPSDITLAEHTINGVVTNISLGGCLLCLLSDNDPGQLQKARDEETPIEMDIHFPHIEEPTRLTAKIRSIAVEDDMCKLGLAFGEENVGVKTFMDSLHLDALDGFFH